MDGYEFRAAQREDPEISRVPVIVVSANGDEQNGRSLGAIGVLSKPVRLAELLGMIDGLRLAERTT
jgi:CheY-like chemotaxis protein